MRTDEIIYRTRVYSVFMRTLRRGSDCCFIVIINGSLFSFLGIYGNFYGTTCTRRYVRRSLKRRALLHAKWSEIYQKYTCSLSVSAKGSRYRSVYWCVGVTARRCDGTLQMMYYKRCTTCCEIMTTRIRSLRYSWFAQIALFMISAYGYFRRRREEDCRKLLETFRERTRFENIDERQCGGSISWLNSELGYMWLQFKFPSELFQSTVEQAHYFAFISYRVD